MLVSRDGNAEASTSRPPRRALTEPITAPMLSSEGMIQSSEGNLHRAPNGRLVLPSSTSGATAGYQASFRSSLSQEAHRHRLAPLSGSSILARYPIHSPALTSKRHRPKIPPQLHSMISGAGAGLVASVVTCPLDVLKTSLQASSVHSGAAEYEGVQKTASRIWRQSGVRGFYRGLGPTLAGYLPTWGIYFTVYDLVKDKLGTWASDPDHMHIDTSIQHIIAAMTAGGTGTIFTNPIWVVKTRFMAQATMKASEARYNSTIEAFSTIYRTEGFRTFYKGLLPSLFGVVHVAVQFPLYEAAKTYAASKMVASVATYPHEVLRTRLQVRRSHVVDPANSAGSGNGIASGSSSVGRPPVAPTAPASSHRPAAAGSQALRGPGPDPHFYSPLVTGSHPPLPLPLGASALTPRPPSVSASPELRGAELGATSRWRKSGGIVDTFLDIKRQDGWKGFYRGLSINLVRTVPNSAVTMLTYELIMRSLAKS